MNEVKKNKDSVLFLGLAVLFFAEAYIPVFYGLFENYIRIIFFLILFSMGMISAVMFLKKVCESRNLIKSKGGDNVE